MNVARLNFSHGTHEEHGRVTATIRQIGLELGVPVAILEDLPGPRPMEEIETLLLAEGAAAPGDPLVVVASVLLVVQGTTNLIHLRRVKERG